MITGLRIALPTWADLGRAAATLWRRPWAALCRWHQRMRERYHVEELDDHLLRDVGLNRELLQHGLAKNYWEY